MISGKKTAIEIILHLPEDASLEEIAEEIGLLVAIRKGEQDADSGRMTSHEEVKGRFRGWVG